MAKEEIIFIAFFSSLSLNFFNFELYFKDTLRVTDNMKYIYEDKSDIPDLQSFKRVLIVECLKRSFFQNVPMKTYNMLKLPLIMAPALLREQCNSDIKGCLLYY